MTGNYFSKSIPGCFVVRPDERNEHVHEFIQLSNSDFPQPYSTLPDISIDPEESLLTVLNNHTNQCKSFTVSLTSPCLPVSDLNGLLIKAGSFTSDGLTWKPCVTFVVMLPPGYCADLAYLSKPSSEGISSDVQLIETNDVEQSSAAQQQSQGDQCNCIGFPLDESSGPFLCCQGFGGSFTHYFASTRYAIDFECEEGTDVVAVGGGIVVSFADKNVVQGILSTNLFSWNSLMIKLDNGIYVEYVHIKSDSVIVNVGDHISKGQKLCESGNVGFSPRPHLHIQLTSSSKNNAETILFSFQRPSGEAYIPIAGTFYP